MGFPDSLHLLLDKDCSSSFKQKIGPGDLLQSLQTWIIL